MTDFEEKGSWRHFPSTTKKKRKDFLKAGLKLDLDLVYLCFICPVVVGSWQILLFPTLVGNGHLVF